MIFVKPLMFEFEPNKVANVTDNGNVASSLSRFITLYERQCLNEILGACLAKELVDSFELTEVNNVWDYRLKSDATQPIKDLVNGKTYDAPINNDWQNSFWFIFFGLSSCGCGCNGDSNACTTRVWKGLAQTNTILVGNATTTEKKSIITDYIYYNYLLENRSITAGSGQQVLSGENSTTVQNFSKRIDAYNRFIDSVIVKRGIVSLYQFLHENKANYPTWVRNCNLNYKTKY
ncbi:hypothetical protein OX284_014235 [Flavobacterium sp. SUN046]|uniref:hypothetical protein n=1 Tax=Flavobacterium sp. SUN046 TaxID=3002440 RepID=UPI002DB6D7F7|nr:hypothetical protein [Flavobacterium sp. SUN046]MEC4050594.1 hypothetical protein [Flavobacterium sp. SUN046]